MLVRKQINADSAGSDRPRSRNEGLRSTSDATRESLDTRLALLGKSDLIWE
jgi:hypothetical protein